MARKLSNKNEDKNARVKYAYVKNLTGDTKLAKKASQWTDERIEKELGVKIDTKKTTKINLQKDKEVLKKRKEEFEVFKEFRGEIEDNSLWQMVRRNDRRGVSARIKKQKKFTQWAKWSDNRNKLMPQLYINRARKLNEELLKQRKKQAKLEKRALREEEEIEDLDNYDYGWIITYNKYLYGGTIEGWKEKLRFKRFDKEFYTVVEAL